MAFHKRGGMMITKADAMDLVENFHEYSDDKTQPRSIYYDREMLMKLLSQEGCVGLKIFFARGRDQKNTLVLFGVDENGIIIENSPASALEVGNPCPPYC